MYRYFDINIKKSNSLFIKVQITSYYSSLSIEVWKRNFDLNHNLKWNSAYIMQLKISIRVSLVKLNLSSTHSWKDKKQGQKN